MNAHVSPAALSGQALMGRMSLSLWPKLFCFVQKKSFLSAREKVYGNESSVLWLKLSDFMNFVQDYVQLKSLCRIQFSKPYMGYASENESCGVCAFLRKDRVNSSPATFGGGTHTFLEDYNIHSRYSIEEF